jgi:hypothetical protein
MLVLNMTNYDTIAMGYGEETDSWRGKRIALFGDKARFGNKIVDCLRIRPVVAPTLDSVAPAQAAIPAQAAAPVAAPAVAQAAAPTAQTVGELIDDAIPDFTAKQAVSPQ